MSEQALQILTVVTFAKTVIATVKAHMQLKTMPMPKKFEMGLAPRIKLFDLSQNFG